MNKADNHPHSTNHDKSGNTGIIIGAVVVLTLIAVWLVPSDKPEHADIPLPAAKPAPAANQARVQPEEAPVPEAETDTTATDAPATDAQAEMEVREGQEAREVIATARQNGASVDALFSKAEEFRQSGRLADAYLLYFQAARQGHAGASTTLAKQADPAFFSPENGVLDKPDITQARKWYLVAINAGDSSAAELLENLHLHVQAQAAAGDPEASRLLLQWK